MFKKIFGGGTPGEPPPRTPSRAASDPMTEALMRAIRERSKDDPYVGAKIGGKEVFGRLMRVLKNDRGVHVESLLCALGALAGYACQASLRAQALVRGQKETAPFHVVTTPDGRDYFYGDPLNNLLAGPGLSVWGLAGGAAQHAGATQLPDLDELFRHTTEAVGGPQFGIPRVPEEHRPGDTPLAFLKALWPPLLPTVKQFAPEPSHWPVLYGMAVQEAIEAGKGVIAPGLALSLVMESAVPMSKVDLARA